MKQLSMSMQEYNTDMLQKGVESYKKAIEDVVNYLEGKSPNLHNTPIEAYMVLRITTIKEKSLQTMGAADENQLSLS